MYLQRISGLILLFFGSFHRAAALHPRSRLKAGYYLVEIFPFVRPVATHAVLYAPAGEAEIASAGIPQKVQRAVAEQAIEIRLGHTLVAGEVFAFLVLKKLVIL